jgi:predicted transposase YbfD/YdcC
MQTAIPALRSMLAQVPDPRKARGQRHPWTALLLLLVGGLLSGANSQRAVARWGAGLAPVWQQRLGLTRPYSPSRATLQRLLAQLDVPQLETVLGSWLQALRTAWRHGTAQWLDGIAVDGKTLRGARRLGARDTHLVSACCQPHSVVLGEVAVPEKSNELSAVEPLLEALLLTGETVTFDAQFTQWVVATQVVQQGAAYFMVVKSNQPTLLADIRRATAGPARRLGEARAVRLAHGRVEERRLGAADARDIAWPYARQVLCLHRRFVHKRTGRVLSDETVYAVTSLTPAQASPADLLRLWQAHWGIENRLHWVRDVIFGEDHATTRTAQAPQALAAFRNLGISLLHLWHRPDITAARADFASHPAALFLQLGLGPPGL